MITTVCARSDATYRVNIKATLNHKDWSNIIDTTKKTIAVTVTKTNLNDGGFHVN
jgi:ribosomal protein L31E